jgi:hypothetical protein
MPDDEERAGEVGGQLSHELFQGFHTTRRGTNGNDVML